MHEQRQSVAIVLFDGVEVLDFAGPYEVLATATDDSGGQLLHVFTAGPRGLVTCHGGLSVRPDHLFADCPPADLLIVPGGPGARETQGSEEIVSFVHGRRADVRTVASVCTGAFLLARAGLLKGHRATTHSQRMAQFQAEFVCPFRILRRSWGMLHVSGRETSSTLALHIGCVWIFHASRISW